MYYENYDLKTVVTPVDVNKFVNLLRESNYDVQETNFLERGLREGFHIWYKGLQQRQSTSANLPFHVGDETILWNKLMKEVKCKWVVGPYESIPFNEYIQSPIGLVPKDDRQQTWLIFHLSFDFKSDGLQSLNYFTPKEKCTVKYKDLDYAIQAYLKVLEENMDGAKESCPPNRVTLQNKWRNKFESHKKKKTVVFSAKSDLKSAFCILGLSPDSWKWLVMKARDPQTGVWKYFLDKSLPFGASISCALFQRFSASLCHIFEYQTQTQDQVMNYLDDFLFLAVTY